ncbi:MAG: LAGLIDADG family homing endonuclease [Acidimicrobiales bacterium]
MQAFDAAYVAGFFDGDGSIHFQLVRQKECRFGYDIRSSVSFSQSTGSRQGLEVLRLMVGGGYVRDRGTGMSDLVVTSRPLIAELLSAVRPYVIFKRERVERAIELLPKLERIKDPSSFLRLAGEVDAFVTLNYSKRKRICAADVEQHLRSMGVLAPVTTSSLATARRWHEVALP